MTDRPEIMSRLKATLDKIHNPTVRFSRADQRIHDARPALLPERGRSEGPGRTVLFVTEAKAAQAEVHQLAALDDVVQAVVGLLQEAGIDRLKIAPDETLQTLDWAGLDVAFGRGEGDDRAGLSLAYAGVAETGTLVMRSCPASPTTLNFLPDLHMVVLREEDLTANYEDVWAKLRAAAEPDQPVLPRTINWITGPSRTADIEQTLLLGAHGPRRLVILLIDAPET